MKNRESTLQGNQEAPLSKNTQAGCGMRGCGEGIREENVFAVEARV